MQYTSIEQVKRANAAKGYHWFDKGTMQSFRSRVGDTIYGGHYFVSSEQFVGSEYTEARKYTVRYACSNGDIETIGEFNSYTSRDSAVRAIQGYLKQERENGHAVVTCTSCHGTGRQKL